MVVEQHDFRALWLACCCSTFAQEALMNQRIRRSLFAVAVLLLLLGLWVLTFPASPQANADGTPFRVGDVFAGVGNGLINHHRPTGLLVDTLNTTSSSTEDTGMCFDSAGNLYATDFNTSQMTKFNNL